MTSKDLAASIIRRLRDRGFQALLVGGCVRDLLLGRPPKDYDVATNAHPPQIVEIFPQAGLVGAQFGVVLVKEEEAAVEVATFRSDLQYLDGRRPEGVRFESSPREDALRRDFTINALFLDPFSGEKIDYVGGVADLDHGIIRAIGDPQSRFREDHLRLIRAIRFAARFRFTIEPATMDALREMAPAIRKVAPERVREELLRILTEGGARYGFELLDSSGLLEQILPEVTARKGVHTLLMLDGLDHPTPTLAMGVLLYDVGMDSARNLLARLKFSNDDTGRILALIAHHMTWKDAANMRTATLKKYLRMPHFDEHLELHRLHCASSNGRLESWEMLRRKFEETPPEQLNPPPLITGNDLIAAGYAPGPKFAQLLSAVEDAQLEGTITTPEEALALVAVLYRHSW